MPDLFSLAWWLGGDDPLTILIVWTLAALAVQHLRYDATIWTDLRLVLSRRLTIRGFVSNGRDCDRCSLYWLTIPVGVFAGPAAWFAVNGAYLAMSEHLPTLADVDDEPPPPPDPPEPIPPSVLPVEWTSQDQAG